VSCRWLSRIGLRYHSVDYERTRKRSPVPSLRRDQLVRLMMTSAAYVSRIDRFLDSHEE
jgi:hypothetical protein